MLIWDIIRYYDGHFEVKAIQDGEVIQKTTITDEDIMEEMDEAYRACNHVYFRCPSPPADNPPA